MDVAFRATAFGACIVATSAATRRLCPTASFAPSRAPLQPPPWVFGVVWPLLFVSTGATWALAPRAQTTDALFGALTLLCCAWLPLYTCARTFVLAAIVLAVATAAAVTTVAVASPAHRWVAVPLPLWLAFATYLNLHRLTRGPPSPTGDGSRARA